MREDTWGAQSFAEGVAERSARLARAAVAGSQRQLLVSLRAAFDQPTLAAVQAAVEACLPHRLSHRVSLTASPTVSPSLRLLLCLPHRFSHCVSLTVSPVQAAGGAWLGYVPDDSFLVQGGVAVVQALAELRGAVLWVAPMAAGYKHAPEWAPLRAALAGAEAERERLADEEGESDDAEREEESDDAEREEGSDVRRELRQLRRGADGRVMVDVHLLPSPLRSGTGADMAALAAAAWVEQLPRACGDSGAKLEHITPTLLRALLSPVALEVRRPPL